MNELILIPISRAHCEVISSYMEEFLRNGDDLNGAAGLRDTPTVEAWIAQAEANRYEETVQEGYAQASTFLGIRKADGHMVGIINIRHCLNEYLLQFGGHIGYSVRKSERQKGYAKEMLRLGLNECRLLGLDRVLVICDQSNLASARTIVANGGVMENEMPEGDGEIIQRYWIVL